MSTTSFHRDAETGSLPRFADAEFSDLGRRLALCRLPCEMPSWRHLDDASAFAVSRALLRADIWSLRSMLARENVFVFRLDDNRVRTEVALLVERGVIGLFERDVAAAEALPAGLAPLPHPVEPPSAPRTSVGRARPAPTASEPSTREDEPTPVLDSIAQVAVLLAAARSGTPFCEECQRRAATKQDAVAA